MYTHLRRWLHTTPAITNPIHRQQAPMVQIIILGIIVLTFILILATLISKAGASAGSISLVISLLLAIISLRALRQGSFNTSVGLLIGLTLLPSVGSILQLGLNAHWSTFFALSIPLMLSGLLGNRRIVWLTVIASMILLGWVTINTIMHPEQYKVMVETNPSDLVIRMFAGLVAFIVEIIFIAICFINFGQTLQRLIIVGLERQHELETLRAAQERVIEERTSELRTSLQTVEQREQELTHTLADLQASKEIISAISAPTIPVMPGVLLVPIVGNLDSQRAEAMTTNTLAAVEKQHSHVVIFDITGVEVVDTHVAQVLLRTASAANLLGAQVIMVGIRPEVAQTMVALGIDLSMFSTYSDLRSALTQLLIHEGWARRDEVSRRVGEWESRRVGE